MISISGKQIVNTKSSTEAELLGVDDAMTFVMWMKYFFESQVRPIDVNSPLKPFGSDVTIKQDNDAEFFYERTTAHLDNERPSSNGRKRSKIVDRN